MRIAHNSEWFKYLDWLARHGIEIKGGTIDFWVRYWAKNRFDRAIRKRLRPAGLFHYDEARVEPVVEAGRRHISPQLTGEAILTVGAAIHEILNPACGIMSIGPFGCMPSRIAEAVLSEKLTTAEKRLSDGHGRLGHLLTGDRRLPFLAIETDGNTFPQIIEARLEAFLLQARRLHQALV